MDPAKILALVAASFFLLLGALFFVLFLLTRLKGKKTAGKILGFIKRQRIKQKPDGEKIKTDLRLVFEYLTPAGELKVGTGSEWGNRYKKFSTGKSVNLLVVSAPNYEDLYLADDFGTLIGALVMQGIGFILIALVTLNPTVWLGVLSAWMLYCVIIASLILGMASKSEFVPEWKKFTMDEIIPLEKIDD